MTPFYKKALALFTRTQENQIQKGLAKYPEPFNPHSWTPEELLNHALEETVDLTHYLVGLKELLDAKDHEIELIHKHWVTACDEIVRLKEELEYANGFKTVYAKEVIKLTKKKSPFEVEEIKAKTLKDYVDMNYQPIFNPHFDTDDQ